jgi:mannose-6-phosphate isomerase
MHGMLDQPLRLLPNRVYRFYRGGALIDRFRGDPEPVDNEYPEDWVGSTTAAINPPDRSYDGEGLSTVEVGGQTVTLASLLEADPVEVVGQSVVDRYGATSALLVKLLDAGIRLPIHAHPTRELARQLFDSQFGKAEAWVILATRQIPGAPSPRVWLGFKETVSRELLLRWITEQDTPAMLGAMNEIEAKPGDAFFVRPGLPHATGAGIFLAEFQEPTDFSIVAGYEGFPISPDEAHMQKGWDAALDCFVRDAVYGDALGDLCPSPLRVRGDDGAGWHEDDLLGVQSHPFFEAHRLVVGGSAPWPYPGVYAVAIVTAGVGTASTSRGSLEIRAGDTFAILGGTAATTIRGDIEMIVATPGLA